MFSRDSVLLVCYLVACSARLWPYAVHRLVAYCLGVFSLGACLLLFRSARVGTTRASA